MRGIVYRIYANPKNKQLFLWIKLISITGIAQVIVQSVGFICGILVIRLLPPQEYALYILAYTMLGTINLLSDGGISTGIMSQGGKVWQDKEKLGVVLATGLDLRRKFAVGSLMVTTPLLIYLLLHHGASWLTSILTVASLIPAFYAALSDSLLEIPPKLHQAILPLQKNEVSVGLGRLLLSGLTLFVFPYTFVAIIASGIPRIYGNYKLRKISAEFVSKKQLPDPEVRSEVLNVVKRILPGTIYYCFSGQIAIWLISIFGNTNAVAQLGALGRIVFVISVLNSIIVVLIIPRFARLKDNKHNIQSFFWKVHWALWILSCIITFLVYFFSKEILWLLGDNYSNLTNEITLSMAGGCISLIAGISLSLYTSRGWVINPMISISLSILALVLGVLVFDIHNLMGVVKLNILVAINQYFVHTIYCIVKIYKLKPVAESE